MRGLVTATSPPMVMPGSAVVATAVKAKRGAEVNRRPVIHGRRRVVCSGRVVIPRGIVACDWICHASAQQGQCRYGDNSFNGFIMLVRPLASFGNPDELVTVCYRSNIVFQC